MHLLNTNIVIIGVFTSQFLYFCIYKVLSMLLNTVYKNCHASGCM